MLFEYCVPSGGGWSTDVAAFDFLFRPFVGGGVFGLIGCGGFIGPCTGSNEFCVVNKFT